MEAQEPVFSHSVHNVDVFLFPWDRIAEQGERVFEVVLLVLWFGFVVSLAYFGLRSMWEKEKKKAKVRRKSNRRPVTFTDRRSRPRN